MGSRGLHFQVLHTDFLGMAFINVFLVLTALSLATGAPQSGSRTPVTDCGSKSEIVSFEITSRDGCDEFPCVIHLGETPHGKLTLISKTTTNTITCSVVGIIPPGIETPFNGCPSENSCETFITGDCPAEVGETFVYEMVVHIEAFYPTITITARTMLKDDAGEDWICFEIPFKIEP